MGFYITDQTQDRGPRAAAPPWGPKPARGPIREVISGYRFYNPDLGRWINRDPIEEEGSMNLNVFLNNNVINLLDPNGEEIYYPGDPGYPGDLPPPPEFPVFHWDEFFACVIAGLTDEGVSRLTVAGCIGCITPSGWAQIPGCCICAGMPFVVFVDCIAQATYIEEDEQ